MNECNKMEGLSVIVPAFNEEQGAETVIKRLLKVINQMNLPTELIIVDDGSTDGTKKILEKFSNLVTVIRHATNHGYGASLKHGIRQARYAFVAITDADGTYPNEQLPKLLSALEDYDMVVGARTGQKVHIPFIRRPAKWLLNKIANYLSDTKIPDLNSGFRVFRKEIVEKYLHILPNGFSFTATITLAMISDGYRVYYEPVDYYRREGRSKIKSGDVMNFLILIIRAITYFNPLRVFLPISLALFGLGFARLCYDIFWLSNITDSTTVIFLFALQVGLIGIVADLIVRRSRP